MNLSSNFHRHLDAELALNDGQRTEAHRLRYDVYCRDRGYENPDKFPDRLEKDEFDNNSVHALVRHKSSDQAAGVVRLVFTDHLNPEKPLPIEMHCGDTFDRAVLDQFEFSRGNIAEVSRFAVSSRFMAGAGIKRSAEDDSSRFFPHISLGLIAMLFVASAHHQITHWYAVMEPSLSRLLSRSGIEFTPIGPVVDYHGKRQPMIAKVDDLLCNVYQKRYDFFKLIDGLGGIPASFAEDMLSAELADTGVQMRNFG
jgi:N-acyl amino acid synthase of PEP-CTERM/exosortase system